MKIKVILNPKSSNGNYKSLEAILKAKFAHSLVDIEQTAHPRHATDIARNAVKSEVDTIVAAGGDGTVNEVLNGIVGTNAALGVIPTGTANDLASLYHIQTNVVKACDIILERCLHHADVIRVNGWCYVTAGGIGLPCEAARVANTIKRIAGVTQLRQILGNGLYIFAVLYALAKRNTRSGLLTIRWNGCLLRIDSLSLMVDNQPFLGKRFLMSPGALNDDGLFDVCLIENPKNRLKILSLAIQVLAGRHIYSPSVKTWRAKKLVVEAETPLTFFGDGEISQNVSAFKIEILPKALNVIVPKTIFSGENIAFSRTKRWRK